MSTVLFLVDDFGRDYCQPYFETGWFAESRQPNITSMALGGVQYDLCFSSPVCSPSRANTETGRFGFRYGVGAIIQPDATFGRLDTRETFFRLANHLTREAGHRCGFFGKDHLSDDGAHGQYGPLHAGFVKWSGIRGNIGVPTGNGTSYTDWDLYNLPPNTVPTRATELTEGVTTHASRQTTADAAAWINDSLNAGKQYFCQLSFTLLHSPYNVPPAADHTYDTSPNFGFTGTPPGDDTYLAMAEALDKYIGEFIAAITVSGRFDFTNDTMIFVADNGTPETWVGAPFNPNHAKSACFRHGTNVPLIVQGKGVVGAGRRTRALVHLVDIYPTICELADVDPYLGRPEGMPLDGVSFAESFSVPTSLGKRKWAYRERFPDIENPSLQYQRSITDGDFDLVTDLVNDVGLVTPQLYDIVLDPYEGTNLLANPATMSDRARSHYGKLRDKLIVLEAAHAAGRSGQAIDPTVL